MRLRLQPHQAGELNLADIIIRRVNGEYGWLGNMAPFPIEHQCDLWRTSEHLFQALRFEDATILATIRNQKSPMAAKMMAKKHKALMAVEPMSAADLENMRLCLRLKVDQHPELRGLLIQTRESLIVEDCTKRQPGSGLFWGAALIDDQWKGQNWLGRLWMELRIEFLRSTAKRKPCQYHAGSSNIASPELNQRVATLIEGVEG